MTWSTTRLKNVARVWISNVDKKTVPGEPEVRLCNYVDVYQNDSITPDLDLMRATASVDQVRTFRVLAGDTIVTKDSETAEDIAIPAFVRQSTPDMVCGYHLAIVRPLHEIHPKYLYWALSSIGFRSQMAALATGVTRFGLRHEAIGSGVIPLPPIEEQRRIGDFLDAETARIAKAADQQGRLIELLGERERSFIESKFRKQMQSRVRLKFLLSEPLSYGANAAAEHEDSAWPRYIRTTDIREDGTLRDDTFKSIPPEQARPYMLIDGDVLLVRSGTVGKSFLYRAAYGPAAYAGYLVRARPDQNKVIPDLIWYFCQTGDYWQQVLEGSIQATIQNVNAEKYGNLLFPWMELSRQQRVLKDLEKGVERIRQLKALAYRKLALLTERRQALITAAVTGEFDVSTASGRGLAE